MKKNILIIILTIFYIIPISSQNIIQQLKPGEWVHECCQQKLDSWKARKKTENKDSYNQRIVASTTNRIKKEFEKECLESFASTAMENQVLSYQYDETTHRLYIHFSDFESIEVNVAPNVAKELLSAPEKLSYCNLKFDLIDSNIIIKEMVIKDQVGKKLYCYGFNPQKSAEKLIGRTIDFVENIPVKDSFLVIKVWDDQRVDGDSISLYFNGQRILDSFSLKKEKKELSIPISFEENVLVLHALNLGKIPPCTASLDINGKRIELTSDLTNSQAIFIKNKGVKNKQLIPQCFCEGEELKCFKAKPQYTILMTEIDDVARCYINGVEIAMSVYGKKGINEKWVASEWRGESGIIDITDRVKKGKNEIRFTVENADCCTVSFKYQLIEGNEIIFQGGIEKTEKSLKKGILLDEKYTWEW